MTQPRIRIVFIGDIMGAAGRAALAREITPIFQTLHPDLLIANGENSAHGIGITPRICEELYAMGVDVITTGNHVYDKKEIVPYIDADPCLIRPANYPEGSPGAGVYTHSFDSGLQVTVINIMGRLFMEALDDPFAKIDEILAANTAKIVFIDMHAEATSEKQCLAAWVDGRVSAVVGTHTHVPTADARILAGGTAYLSDAGFTGDYDSIIGMQRDAPLEGFTKKIRTRRMEPAEGPGTVCGCVIDVNPDTGKAIAIEPIRLGPHLRQTPLDQVAAALENPA